MRKAGFDFAGSRFCIITAKAHLGSLDDLSCLVAETGNGLDQYSAQRKDVPLSGTGSKL